VSVRHAETRRDKHIKRAITGEAFAASRKLLLFLFLFASPFAFASDFRTKDTVVNLSSGSGEIVIIGEKLNTAELQQGDKAVLTDFNRIDKLTFVLDKSKTEHLSADSIAWHFKVATTSTPPSSPQTRQLSFSLGRSPDHPIAVTLTGQKTDAKIAGWTVDGPTSPWNISRVRAIDFVVVTIGTGLKGIRLTHSSLIDSGPGRGIPLPLNHLHICKKQTDDAKSCPEMALLDGSRTTLWLVVDDEFKENGNFVGSVQMDTDPLGDTKNVSLTIQQSSCGAQLVGAALIGIGVLIAWLVLAYGRTRISRAQALLPATLLREKVASLLLTISKLPPPLLGKMATTEQVLGDLSSKLSEAYLDAQNYLPPSIPSVIGTASIQLGAYQAFLQICSQKIEDLEIIVNEGLVPAASKYAPGMPAGSLQALQALVGDIDALSGNLPQADQVLRNTIGNIFKTWNTQVVTLAMGGALSLSIPQARPKTIVELRMQIQLLTRVFWLVWGGLALLLGIAVLIIPNTGFGGPMDLIRCFFWGFGLPVAGQSLQQVTLSNFNSNFGVTLSR
jgi:hypothetical protein